MFNKCILTVMCYGAKKWTTTQKNMNKYSKMDVTRFGRILNLI